MEKSPDGSLTGHAGGLDRWLWMLQLEGDHV
jgi:O6-methylguanine-DNA--protein-cysteine methyltransferase